MIGGEPPGQVVVDAARQSPARAVAELTVGRAGGHRPLLVGIGERARAERHVGFGQLIAHQRDDAGQRHLLAPGDVVDAPPGSAGLERRHHRAGHVVDVDGLHLLAPAGAEPQRAPVGRRLE
ncbi:MAG TPA: hypothetical protein VM824_07945, partial [Thermoleophilaceae bacterium]|nr:hypothetical protein [Thermoleophilaceae bacterium]